MNWNKNSLLSFIENGRFWSVVFSFALVIVVLGNLFGLLVVYLLTYHTGLFQEKFDIVAKLTPLAATIVVLAIVAPYNYAIISLIRVLARKRDEAEALQLTAQKKSGDQAKLMAYVSHEIRNLLNGITGLMDAMEVENFDERNAQKIGIVKESIKELQLVLADILEVSKIEKEGLVLRPEEVSLHQIMQSSFDFWKSRAKAKGLKIKLVICDQFPDQVELDEHRFKQVINNLISNAIKYTDKGRILITADCENPIDGRAVIKVSDTGRGIPKEQHEQIFTPYAQVISHSDGENRQISTGLGLSIARELARLMGGDIWLLSSASGGSRFAFEFAYKEAKTSNAPKLQIDYEHIGKGKKALIADDGRVNCIVAREYLQKMGFEVEMVYSGQECIDYLLSQDVNMDLLLLDDSLGDMEGQQVLDEIRGKYQGSIMSYTGNIKRGLGLKASEDMVPGFLAKPIEVEKLNAEIARIFIDAKPVPSSS